MLETPDGAPLRYAVVGISNWALDASKSACRSQQAFTISALVPSTRALIDSLQ